MIAFPLTVAFPVGDTSTHWFSYTNFASAVLAFRSSAVAHPQP